MGGARLVLRVASRLRAELGEHSGHLCACCPSRLTDIGNSQYKDVSGLKAYSNRKVGRLAVDALLSSKVLP